MKWLVVDSLYCPEQFFCSHLDSYSHYLREAGEDAHWAIPRPDGGLFMRDFHAGPIDLSAMENDVALMLDRYDLALRINAEKLVAQCAAITNPLPWNVRKADGSPAYDLVISSIPWMVEEARAKGCRAEYMPLAFDTRARVCGMGVKRERKCIFIGSQGPNHRRRTELLHELRDIVEVLPPVFGREYFRALASAQVVLNVHAEWSRGIANNMRLFEACGMGCSVVSDGAISDPGITGPCWLWMREPTPTLARNLIGQAFDTWDDGFMQPGLVFRDGTYESRIPRLIELARSLP